MQEIVQEVLSQIGFKVLQTMSTNYKSRQIESHDRVMQNSAMVNFLQLDTGSPITQEHEYVHTSLTPAEYLPKTGMFGVYFIILGDTSH
jgi:transcriptional regulator of met regulon